MTELSEIYETATRQIIAQGLMGNELSPNNIMQYNNICDEILNETPNHTGANFLKGYLLSREDNNDFDSNEALLYLEKAKQDYSNDINFIEAIGDSYFNTKEYKKALPFLQKLLKKYPNNLFTTFSLSYAHFKLGNIQESVEFFKKSLPELTDIIPHHQDQVFEMIESGLHALEISSQPRAEAKQKLNKNEI